MNMPQQARTATTRPPKAALNWVDFLVIAATILTFAVVVLTNNPHSRRASSSWSLKDTAIQTGQAIGHTDLGQARVRLASGGPWS